jgi:Abortive infection C-terminus
MSGLTSQELTRIVNRYIGVTDGYLGNFSYRTHAEFYPEYCDLDIDPNQLGGTTRERFISILKNSTPEMQARIIRGVLQRFPVEAENKPVTRTLHLYNEVVEVARRLESASPVTSPEPKITSAIVERALGDAETLIRASGAISGIDRAHTALHGYLRAVCDQNNIPYSREASLAKLFKLLRENHPALQYTGERQQEITRVFHALSNILDALNPIRNEASVAHPNQSLLGKSEAMLVINVTRTLLHYLDGKISEKII